MMLHRCPNPCYNKNPDGWCLSTVCIQKPVVVYYDSTANEKTAKTNADRIRSMSDEELADEILSWFNWLNAVEWDDKRIIEWLKQEVSTDG